jgi:hypothetical protein
MANTIEAKRAYWRAQYKKHRSAILKRKRANPGDKQAKSIANRSWRQANADKVRDAYLKRNYGISLAIYDRLAAVQHDVCAICKQPETRVCNGTLQALSVDHDHAALRPGWVRGLLCNACNTLLGKLGDDIERARAVVAYLVATR